MTTEAQASLADALRRVAEHSADWRPWADLALYNTATDNERFTSDEVWRTLKLRSIPPPSEPRAMGPVMLAGVRRRWLVPTDEFVTIPEPATGRHPGPQRVYISRLIGAPYISWPDRGTNLDQIPVPAAPRLTEPVTGGHIEGRGTAQAPTTGGQPKCPICKEPLNSVTESVLSPGVGSARCLKCRRDVQVRL